MSAQAIELIHALKVVEFQAVNLVESDARLTRQQTAAVAKWRKRLSQALSVLEARG